MGGCEERQWCRNKTPNKKTKSLRTAAARPFLAGTTNRARDLTHPRVHISSILRLSGKNLKNAFFKMTSVLQPQGRSWPQNQTLTKFGILKKNCKRHENYSQSRCAKSRCFRTSRRCCGHALARNRSQTPFFKHFACLDLFNSTDNPKMKKTAEGEPRQQRWAPIPKDALFRKPRFSHRRFSEVKFAKCKPQFRTIKHVVSETTGRLLALPGPLINS